MITISKKIKISKATQKIELDVENLPEGAYEVKLFIGENAEIATGKDYSLENWSSGIILTPLPTFKRAEMYGDKGR